MRYLFRFWRRGQGSTGRLAVAGAIGVAAIGGGLATAISASAAPPYGIETITTAPDAPAPTPGYTANPPANDGSGLSAGKIKHVWVIVLENKTYNSTFTGLNHNTYLWQTLPDQGALLQNYFGTGHSSLDNYLSLASGQAPVTDNQANCPAYDNLSGTVDTSGSLATNPNYGQLASAAGAEAPAGKNGCVYPKNVPTIFNQLDSAGKSWKVYNQDMGTTTSNDPSSDETHNAGVQYCGAPDSSPAATGTSASNNTANTNNNNNPTGAGTYNPSGNGVWLADQYVAKHSPLPWFQSLLQSGDCNSAHVADLFDAGNGLYHDLQNESTTPTFSWIDPNLCSDAHDAVCAGNNLSGGWKDPNTPNAPVNFTGGLYASDLFLEHIIPEIEASAAFKDGGLIDITFDEAYPEFTWSDSRYESTLDRSTAADMLREIASAGETLWGRGLAWEPQGPNTPLIYSSTGQALSAGAGYNRVLDRPINPTPPLVPCTSTGNPLQGQCFLGGGGGASGYVDGARTTTTHSGATAAASSTTIADNSIQVTDEGRPVSGTGIPANSYVGQVTETAVDATASQTAHPSGFSDTGSFTLVDANGNPVATSAAVSGITLGAESDANDPLYDAFDGTPGGGRTGDVLISQYIKPGTVSQVDYNHYSALRSFEDLLGLGGGLDNSGHIGYAAQPGLAPFGPDVFTNVGTGSTTTTVTTTTQVIVCVVPKVKGDSLSTARGLIKAAQCKVGKVTKPKHVKKHWHLVVKSSSPSAGKIERRGTKVKLVLKAVR